MGCIFNVTTMMMKMITMVVVVIRRQVEEGEMRESERQGREDSSV